MTAPVLVTRPATDAAQWVRDLQAQGIAAQALPLIHIGPCQHPQTQAALETARNHIAQYDALMFVSGNAVGHFFDDFGQNLGQNRPQTLIQQARTAIKIRAWTPGPGTARVLLALGFPPERIDGPAPQAAQYDSENLWAEVAGQIQPGSRILIVRGCQAGTPPGDGQGRDWLAARIREAGGQVDFAVAYERGAPLWSAEELALAQQGAAGGALWLLSSSEAIAHLCAALPGQGWEGARALATHPRIAAAARAAGFGIVNECKPALADVLQWLHTHHSA